MKNGTSEVMAMVMSESEKWNKRDHPLREAMLEGCQDIAEQLLQGKLNVSKARNERAYVRQAIYNAAMGFLRSMSAKQSMKYDSIALLPRNRGGYSLEAIKKRADKVLHSPREKAGFKAFFIQEKSIQDVADSFKISHSASARLKKRIIAKLATSDELRSVFFDVSQLKADSYNPEKMVIAMNQGSVEVQPQPGYMSDQERSASYQEAETPCTPYHHAPLIYGNHYPQNEGHKLKVAYYEKISVRYPQVLFHHGLKVAGYGYTRLPITLSKPKTFKAFALATPSIMRASIRW